jgi:hypothetical protein
MATYSYGENAETHYSILVFFKRLLAYYETYAKDVFVPAYVWDQLSKDPVVHPKIQEAITAALTRAKAAAVASKGELLSHNVFQEFLAEEGILPEFCKDILHTGFEEYLIARLRTLLSVAAFEEDQERLAQSQNGVDTGNIAWKPLV